MSRHIVALGGGGFPVATGKALMHFIDGLAPRAHPRVCFIPTASGDSLSYVVSFYEAFPANRHEPSHLFLFQRSIEDLRTFLLGQDIIYVGGGNTVNMLAVWRIHGVDQILREAWEKGIVLAGVSAGSICWFQAGVTDSFGPTLAPLHDGLGLIAGSNCPHYDSEPLRRPTYQRAIAAGMEPGIAAEDGVALHYEDGRLAEIVSSCPGARAYRVEAEKNGVVETPLIPRYLETS